MKPEEILTAVETAGAEGVSHVQLFNGVGVGKAQVHLTNTLAAMRRDGSVVARRLERDGVTQAVYFTPENAPALPAPVEE